MSALEEQHIEYLTEKGVLPRLLEILEQLVDIDPPPPDPLMHILHALGCPLIPQSQMKALERKVSRAHEELRYLRRLLIELGGEDDLYDSGSDEEQYVGAVELVLSPDSTLCETSFDTAASSPTPTATPSSHYVVKAVVVAVQDPPTSAATSHIVVDDEKPCCSRSIYAKLH